MSHTAFSFEGQIYIRVKSVKAACANLIFVDTTGLLGRAYINKQQIIKLGITSDNNLKLILVYM